MANTTFKGTLRSEGGYSSIATAASTGVETTQMSISSAGFTSLDANTMATEAGAGITGGTGTVVTFTAVPAADEFLYLTLGATTNADYTAGKLLIELFGYEA